MANKEFESPWEQPAVKVIIDIFNGSVTKVVSLNEVNMTVDSNNNDDRW